jgi:MFS family permease
LASRVSKKVAVSVVYVAAMFMTIMDATIVNVALPTIGRDFRVPSTSVASVSIYVVPGLPSGRAGPRVQHLDGADHAGSRAGPR